MSKEPLGDKLDDFRTQYKAEQAALRQRIATLERERDQLAAALLPIIESAQDGRECPEWLDERLRDAEQWLGPAKTWTPRERRGGEAE